MTYCEASTKNSHRSNKKSGYTNTEKFKSVKENNEEDITNTNYNYNFGDTIDEWYYVKKEQNSAENLLGSVGNKVSDKIGKMIQSMLPKITFEKGVKNEVVEKAPKPKSKIFSNMNPIREEINKNILDDLVLKEIKRNGFKNILFLIIKK